jgi:hypothetical protein
VVEGLVAASSRVGSGRCGVFPAISPLHLPGNVTWRYVSESRVVSLFPYQRPTRLRKKTMIGTPRSSNATVPCLLRAYLSLAANLQVALTN